MRDGDTVKHYRIRQLDEGGFFIARRTTFRYSFDLIFVYACVCVARKCKSFKTFESSNRSYQIAEHYKNWWNTIQKIPMACVLISGRPVYR